MYIVYSLVEYIEETSKNDINQFNSINNQVTWNAKAFDTQAAAAAAATAILFKIKKIKNLKKKYISKIYPRTK